MQLWCAEGGGGMEVVVVVVLALAGGLMHRRTGLQILTNPLPGLMRQGVTSEVADYI